VLEKLLQGVDTVVCVCFSCMQLLQTEYCKLIRTFRIHGCIDLLLNERFLTKSTVRHGKYYINIHTEEDKRTTEHSTAQHKQLLLDCHAGLSESGHFEN